jgi:hypothetical protein
MNQPVNRRLKFRFRALTSVLITSAFVVLLVSGIILFAAPPGRVANWTNWALLGLRKSEWAGLHITFSALFLLATILHLVFNWRPLVGYFRLRLGEAKELRWEWAVALVLAIAVYAGTRANVPPFSSLISYSESWRESWETPRQRAPIPHAELLTLQELADKAVVSMTIVSNRLGTRGITGFATNTVVRDLASQSGISAQQLYEIMTATSAVPASGKAPGVGEKAGHNAGSGRGPGGSGGGGPGRKTLAEYCADEGLDLQATLKRLEAKGIKAGASVTMREIAVNNGYSRPYEILDLIKGEAK